MKMRPSFKSNLSAYLFQSKRMLYVASALIKRQQQIIRSMLLIELLLAHLNIQADLLPSLTESRGHVDGFRETQVGGKQFGRSMTSNLSKRNFVLTFI